MQTNATIVVTGAAGFIGSALTGFLNKQGFKKLILVDEFASIKKTPNLESKNYITKIERDHFFNWLAIEKKDIDFIFHLASRTDTTEFDYSIHQQLNVDYSIRVWQYSTSSGIPLVY